MVQKKSKSPSESAVETRYLVMPSQANPAGTVFGGEIMSMIDMVAGMVAERHAQCPVVTASIDSIFFHTPIHVGEQVVLKSAVNYVGRTSMEVGVQVIREKPQSGESIKATTAHLTFVAVDKNGRPVEVCKLAPRTAEEKRRYRNAQIRVKTRKQLLARIEK
jgi:acyl-CoA hydrolase